MDELSENATLKEINAYKKKITWGEVPTVYQMAHSSVSELDGILTHGFESAYKQIFDKNLWNLKYLSEFKDDGGIIQKPKIMLKHVYDKHHYELHCYPIVKGEVYTTPLIGHPHCPFINWHPESMQMLFRLSNLVSFIIYSFQGGDKADLALVRYSYLQVCELIEKLEASFQIEEIKGYNIADFYKEIYRRQPNFHITDLLDIPND